MENATQLVHGTLENSVWSKADRRYDQLTLEMRHRIEPVKIISSGAVVGR